jgi:pilus assembly protein Flp/PilA
MNSKSNLEIHTMKNFKNVFAELMNDESGQDLIEYALVAGLIGLGAVVAMTTLSTTIGTSFSKVSSSLSSAT